MFQLRSVLAPLLSATLAVGLLAPPALAVDAHPEAKRIVSIGGTVTEILYALGAGERIVARDSTSSYPAEANAKPDVGYMRALSPEGIFGQKPDLILAEDGAGPADAVTVLKAGQIPYVMIDTPPKAEAIAQKIRDVGQAVGLDDKAGALAQQVDADLARLKTDIDAIHPDRKKRVLFVLSLSGGRIMAAGKDTEAGALVEMAGGVNAAEGISGYKPLSDEAVIAAKPDFVLMMKTGQHQSSAEQVFAVPALAASPAAAAKSFLAMDGLYLVGFGPRTPSAARELASALYPGQVKP